MLVAIPVSSMAFAQNTTINSMSSLNNRAIVDVSIQDYSFSPTPVTITVGDTVRWTNNGPSIHTSTSDTAVWDSGLLNVGQTYSFTFTIAGTYPYHCTPHPFMQGTVIVSGANLPPNTPTEPAGPGHRNVGQSGSYSTMTTDPNGDQVQYRFDWNATGSHDISAWSGLVPSGQTFSMSHAWTVVGTYVVMAQARDSLSATSSWSIGFTVVVIPSGHSPNTPTTPTGPSTRLVGQSGTYNTSAIDPNGDQVQYRFDFDANGTHDYSAYTVLMPSGQTGSMSHIWNTSGAYIVKAQARDSVGQTSNWSSGLTVVISTVNQPPNTPLVTGPSQVKVGVMAEFTATSLDPNGDMIEYYFDFGDGTNSGWTPMVNSGFAAHVNHSFTKKGTYTVKAKVRDTSLAESAYGSVPITVPAAVSYTPVITFLRFILERLIQLFPRLDEFIHL